MHGWTENTAQGLDSIPDSTLAEGRAWLLLRALASAASAGQAVAEPCGIAVDDTGKLERTALGDGWLDVFPGLLPLFKVAPPLAPSVRRMLELYLPLCVGLGSGALVLAHMGQSLDGQIATSTGASRFITGAQDLEHMHRLRALFDAVVVGRSTVTCDDPKLTTRLVAGANPIRVVLDPELHAPCDRKVFRDGEAGTLVLCRQGRAQLDGHHGCAEIAELPSDETVLPPRLILALLRGRGLRRIFVEGGGVTVSHFLQAGLLDRIHIVVSPVFLGRGRPGATLPMIDGLDQALRPRVRRFHLGEDVLFDCDLRG